jgi:hypothetical protein
VPGGFEIKVISNMFQSLARRGMESDRKIFAVAELATGKPVRSKPLEIPDRPLTQAPPPSEPSF